MSRRGSHARTSRRGRFGGLVGGRSAAATTPMSPDSMRRILDITPDGVLTASARDGVLRIRRANHSVADALAVPVERLVGAALSDLLVLDDPSVDLDAMVRPDAAPWRGWAHARHRHQSWLDVTVTPVSNGEGTELAVVMLDLTNEVAAKSRLEQHRRFTDAILDTIESVVIVVDDEGRVVRCNHAACAISGYAERQLIGRQVWETVLTPMDSGHLTALFAWPNRSGASVLSESVFTSAAGERIEMAWSCDVVEEPSGPPRFAVITGVNVTEERSHSGLVDHVLKGATRTTLIGCSSDGVILTFSAGASATLGWSEAEVIGRPLMDLFEAESLAEWVGTQSPESAFQLLVASYAGDQPPSDWNLETKDGERRVISLSLSTTPDAVAGRVPVVCIGHDVTEERIGQAQVEAALETERRAVQQLTALDAAKDEFVQTASHELRTPTTSIIGYTHMLLEGPIKPADRQVPLLETIERNAKRLHQICDDLLMLAGLGLGGVNATTERVDLVASMDAVEETMRPVLDQRDVEVVYTKPDAPVEVVGNPAQLERLVQNLVSNAIKFTEDGGRVEASLQAEDEDVLVRVSDTGIGLSDADQAAVFDRFYRTAEAERRAVPGTGLGLTISQQIVDAHGGSIEVESAEGVGSTFTIRLPVAAAPLQAVPASDAG